MLGWLLGSTKAADTARSAIVDGVDAMFYTDEEKARAREKGFELWIEYQKATAPQNVARRLIALVVTAVWSLLILGAVLAHGLGAVDFAIYLRDVLRDLVIMPFGIVVTFYFMHRIAGGAVEAWAQRRQPTRPPAPEPDWDD